MARIDNGNGSFTVVRASPAIQDWLRNASDLDLFDELTVLWSYEKQLNLADHIDPGGHELQARLFDDCVSEPRG